MSNLGGNSKGVKRRPHLVKRKSKNLFSLWSVESDGIETKSTYLNMGVLIVLLSSDCCMYIKVIICAKYLTSWNHSINTSYFY